MMSSIQLANYHHRNLNQLCEDSSLNQLKCDVVFHSSGEVVDLLTIYWSDGEISWVH